MPRSSSWATRPNAELLFIDKGMMFKVGHLGGIVEPLYHRPSTEFAVDPDNNGWLSIEEQVNRA